MEQRIFEHNNTKIAEIISDDVEIKSVQDALDLMGNADYEGARCIAIYEHNFDPSFFDLRTGIAGEILQKYATYNVKLAIIGDFEKYESNAFKAFRLECNRGRLLFFVPDLDTATNKMTE